jgi:hypothetical protein
VAVDPRAAGLGAVAEDYERGRPKWPERVVEVAELPPSTRRLAE